MTKFKFDRLDKRGTTKIVASNGAADSFTLRADLQDEEGRAKAVERIAARFPGLDRDRIVEALEGEAAREDPPTDKVADALLNYLRQPGQLELFHSPEGDLFALVRLAARKQNDQPRHVTLRVRSPSFRDWLAREAYLAGFKALASETLQTVTNLLAADARFSGPELPVFVRIGEHEGAVYLDLANDESQVVRVNRQGWEIIRAVDAPVRMVRVRGMLALPLPERGDSKDTPARVGELRRFLNVDDGQWVLVRGFVIGMFRPRGSHAALVLTAEHGCGKSWTAEVLRELLDPNLADNRRPPKDERDLAIAARNGHVISLNNLSGLQPWLSDSLCSVLDGGGLATRELYSDSEETIFAGARPVILNGIEDVATRPDLADRAVHLMLRRMDEAKLTEENVLRAEFKAARPRILGALLDAVECALRREGEVRLSRKPRRLDFARWVEAAAPALGLRPGEFLSAYMQNRAGASAAALESSPFAVAVRDLIEERRDWFGSMSDLLAAVSTDERRKLHGWPATPRKAGAVLRTFAPCLRANGIEVEDGGQGPESRRSLKRLRRVPAQSFETFDSSGSTSVASAEVQEPNEATEQDPSGSFAGVAVSDAAGNGSKHPKCPNDLAGAPGEPKTSEAWSDPADAADMADPFLDRTVDLYAELERVAIQEEGGLT